MLSPDIIKSFPFLSEKNMQMVEDIFCYLEDEVRSWGSIKAGEVNWCWQIYNYYH